MISGYAHGLNREWFDPVYSASPDMSATIRVAVAGDVGAIADIYTSIVEDTYISFETAPPSEDDSKSDLGHAGAVSTDDL